MKCHKCGFEFTGSVCPKCGANAIVVNSDYLKRKKEYEENGKITIGNVEFRKSDDKDTFVSDEEPDPIDVLKEAYKKMQGKSTSAKKKPAAKKSPKKKAAKKPINKIVLKRNIVRIGIVVVSALAAIMILSAVIKYLTRPDEPVYIYSEGGVYDAANVHFLVNDESGLYLYSDGKKNYITKEKADNIRYNYAFSLVVYDVDKITYIYSDGKLDKLNDQEIAVSSDELLVDGYYYAYVVYAEGVYSLYEYTSKNENVLVSVGDTAKEIIRVLQDGSILYKDTEYSQINSANSIKLILYKDGNKRCLMENYIDSVLTADGELYITDNQNQLYLVSLKGNYSKKLINDNVTALYTKGERGVYTKWAERYAASDDVIIFAKDNDYYSLDINDGKTEKLFTEKETVDSIVCDKTNVYYVANKSIKNKKGSVLDELLSETSYLYNYSEKELTYIDLKGKLKYLKADDKKKDSKYSDVSKIFVNEDGISYTFIDGSTSYITLFDGKKTEKMCKGECVYAYYSGRHIYCIDIDTKLYIFKNNGKKKGESEKINKILQKG